MYQPLISIIIPTYNRAHLISETLESILAQTYTNWECIIVDDASTDNTVEIIDKFIKKDNRFTLYIRPNDLPKGANSCRNFGFLKSKGEYIKWFDSDDILHENAIQNQIQYFQQNKDLDIVISKIQIVDSKTKNILKINKIESENLIVDYFTNKVSFYVCGPLWKKSFLENKQLFDINISNLDDWDFNLRMLSKNPNFSFDNQVIANYISHQDSLSKEINKLNISEIASEFNARTTVFELYKNRLLPQEILTIIAFNKQRYRYVLTTSLVLKNDNSKWILYQYLKFLWKNKNYFQIIKTTFVFILIKFFNKGYKYL